MKAKAYVADVFVDKCKICEGDSLLTFEDQLKISEELFNRWLRRTGNMSKMIKALNDKPDEYDYKTHVFSTDVYCPGDKEKKK